eukprot:1288293-Amphidinium_carterae.1
MELLSFMLVAVQAMVSPTSCKQAKTRARGKPAVRAKPKSLSEGTRRFKRRHNMRIAKALEQHQVLSRLDSLESRFS